MIRAKEAPRLRVSGADCFGRLLCLAEALRKHSAGVGSSATALVEAADLLIRYMEILHTHPAVPECSAGGWGS
eukprot:7553020-Alexandrium_andersonii.AAC.1